MRALVIDCETTGLVNCHTARDEVQPEITEWFSCDVDLDTGEVFGETEQLIRPRWPLSEEITRITGLTDETLKDAPRFSEAFPRIKAAIEAASCIIGHNLSFDVELVCLEAERAGTTIKWPRLICTVEQTLCLTGFRLSLQALHIILFGTGFPSAHRARIDVEALVRCCIELRKRGEL